MSEYLFTYGTLQPGLAPKEMAAAVARLIPIGEGFVHGVLYDLGHYPGAVLDADSAQRIFGTVFELPGDPNLLREFDGYEEFDPERLEASQFVRLLYPVRLAEGGALPCWIYAYNRQVGGLQVLDGGRFQKKHPA